MRKPVHTERTSMRDLDPNTRDLFLGGPMPGAVADRRCLVPIRTRRPRGGGDQKFTAADCWVVSGRVNRLVILDDTL